MGFRTISGKKLTLKGVKPEQIIQWHYDYYYLYGAECTAACDSDFKSESVGSLVEPKGGRSFFYELSHFNSKCFEKYLEKFAQQYAEEIHIIQLDNASVHTAKKLKLPDNVVLLFQLPLSCRRRPPAGSAAMFRDCKSGCDRPVGFLRVASAPSSGGYNLEDSQANEQ